MSERLTPEDERQIRYIAQFNSFSDVRVLLAEIDALRLTLQTSQKDNESLRSAAALAESEVARLREIMGFLVLHRPKVNGDWACAECKPYSDMLVAGFQCAWHSALTILGLTWDEASGTVSPSTAEGAERNTESK